jgi:23S rRNA (adenine2503-C2)-methyltransferase
MTRAVPNADSIDEPASPAGFDPGAGIHPASPAGFDPGAGIHPGAGTDAASRHSPLGWLESEWVERAGALLAELGEPAYRARQLREWVFAKTPGSFAEMSDLPARLRETLETRVRLHPLDELEHQISRDGTQKFLWQRLEGAGNVESVTIPDGKRSTYCISSQAGCPVKCPFCATGHGGFQGQLSAAEIVDQVVRMRHRTGSPPTNIVFMGMGEPLLNFPEVLRSIEILTQPSQIGLGSRRLTVSTVGIPDRIRELARAHPQVQIALSLHAARDELRDELVPLNRRHPLASVIDALRDCVQGTNRWVTVEYVVLPGVNDGEADIAALSRVLRNLPCRINLIGFNPFPGAPYSKPGVASLVALQRRIQADFRGPVTIRRPRGEDIHGACGQLSLRAANGGAARAVSPA